MSLLKLAASSKEAFLSKLKHLEYTDLNKYTQWAKIPKKDRVYSSLHHELNNLHNSATKSISRPENNLLHERVKEYSGRIKDLIKKDKRLNLLNKLKNIPKH